MMYSHYFIFRKRTTQVADSFSGIKMKVFPLGMRYIIKCWGIQQQICKIKAPFDLHCLTKVTEISKLDSESPKSEFPKHRPATLFHPRAWKAFRGSFTCQVKFLGCLVKEPQTDRWGQGRRHRRRSRWTAEMKHRAAPFQHLQGN